MIQGGAPASSRHGRGCERRGARRGPSRGGVAAANMCCVLRQPSAPVDMTRCRSTAPSSLKSSLGFSEHTQVAQRLRRRLTACPPGYRCSAQARVGRAAAPPQAAGLRTAESATASNAATRAGPPRMALPKGVITSRELATLFDRCVEWQGWPPGPPTVYWHNPVPPGGRRRSRRHAANTASLRDFAQPAMALCSMLSPSSLCSHSICRTANGLTGAASSCSVSCRPPAVPGGVCAARRPRNRGPSRPPLQALCRGGRAQ